MNIQTSTSQCINQWILKLKYVAKIITPVLFFAITLCSCAQKSEPHEEQIKSYLNNLNGDDFSGTIFVAKNDSIIERRSYGFANIEHKIKNKFDTKFNIASITKMITAVGVLKLFDEGTIKLHKPIGMYLPDYPNKTVREQVTIHHLLTHTSGLNNFYEVNFLETEKLQYNSIKDFLPLFVNDPLLSKPGEKYHYSASGFVVLGLIIEKLSGQSYYDYIQEQIFKAADMQNSTELAIDSIVQNKADVYTSFFGDNNYLKRADYYLSKASPAGFYYATAEDLFKFSKALRNGKLLKKETFKLMSEPKVKGYSTHIGYGIDIDLRYNQPIIGHSGGWYGIRAELIDFTRDEYTVVILSNIDDDGKTGTSMVKEFFIQLIASR